MTAPAPVCAAPNCGKPAAARVAYPLLPPPQALIGLGFVIVRPATTPNPMGDLLCVDCCHHVVDLMLLRATPEPKR